MPKIVQVLWKQLVWKLHQFGFEGPYAGGKHLYRVKGNLTITVPNPHHRDIGIDLLTRILKQAEISRELWAKTR